jgi:hypothetical protein
LDLSEKTRGTEIMWIIFNDAYLSIVKPDWIKDDDSVLNVRARFSGDIEKVFPGAKVEHTPERDYAYRALVSRAEVAKAMSDRVMNIQYSNFKDSVVSKWRHDLYLDVWTLMYRAQDWFSRVGLKKGKAVNPFKDY